MTEWQKINLWVTAGTFALVVLTATVAWYFSSLWIALLCMYWIMLFWAWSLVRVGGE